MFKIFKIAVPALMAAAAMLTVFGGSVSGKDAYIGLSSPNPISQPPSAAPVRVELNWSTIEVSPGIYNWSRVVDGVSVEKIVKELVRGGSAPMLVLSGGPVYLPHLAGQQAVDSNALLERWQAFISAAVEHFGAQTDFWQIGSGINNPAQWAKVVYPAANQALAAPDPVLYGQMLRAAAQIINAKDSSSQVLLGSLEFSEDCSAAPLAYLEALAIGADWGLFDAAVIELPAFTAAPENAQPLACTGESDALNEIGMFLNSHSKKTFWVSGLRWERSALEQAAAARGTLAEIVETDYLTRQSTLLAATGVSRVLWQPAQEGFSLPVQHAFTNLGAAIGAARFENQSTNEDGSQLVLRFRRGGRSSIVLWRVHGGDAALPAVLQGFQGMRVTAYSVDSQNLSAKSGVALSVDEFGWSGLMLSERPVILLASHTDVKAAALAALEDKTAALGNALQSAFSGWFETQKSKAAGAISDWAKEQQRSLLNMIKIRFEDWVKTSLGIASR